MTAAPGDRDGQGGSSDLADRWAITELVNRYCSLVDDHDLDGIMGLFTDDGRFGRVGSLIDGPDAIRAHYRNRLAGTAWTLHYVYSHFVTGIDGDEATGIVNGGAQMAYEDGVKVAALRYHDTYRRVDGQWRFVERAQKFWYFLPLADLVNDCRTPFCRFPADSVAELPGEVDGHQRFLREVAEHAK